MPPVPGTPAPSRRGRASAHTVDAWQLTDVVNRLRRVLRTSIRADYPWETAPMAQIEVLQRLRDEPGLRLNDLAARHRLANNTVSTIVQQMVVAGLVDRTADPADRRAVRLTPTTLGTTMLADWQTAHELRFTRALDGLDPAERAALSAALPALARLVEELEQSERSPDETDR